MVQVCACTYTRFVLIIASHFLSQSVFEPFLVLPLVLFCLYSSLSSHTVHSVTTHYLVCSIASLLFTLQSLSIISSSSSSLPLSDYSISPHTGVCPQLN